MNSNTQRIAITAVLTALLLAVGPLAINVGPIPMTLQTLIIALVASVSSMRVSLTAIGLYLVLGALGLPVLAGFKGGIVLFFGPTGGYLWSFLLFSPIIGLSFKKWRTVTGLIVTNCVATILNLTLGTIWLSISAHMSAQAAIAAGVTPFIVSSVLKIVIVVVVALAIRQLQSRTLVAF
ncbi:MULTISPECIES: biotin transporter BioY [Leuconostoc]|uniref:Biotin transporter n=1 Tax=Leuconostoc kimchii TaxID=136609 RepID=A0ABX5SL23_9LACO|nr:MULTISPECIES: biotin transporter BioY [Leuconostoc]AEJ31693.1 putative biotin biosynthesis protein BioY [Leuconostoc sp. C2]QBR46865.1 biotin transporter BioY [Leuconostoc kimchii]